MTPCRVDESFESSFERAQERIKETKQYMELKKEADKVTRMLCSVMRELEKREGDSIMMLGEEDTVDFSVKDLFFDKIEGLSDWWEEHKIIDKKRIKKELLDKIDNLTLEEMEAVKRVLEEREGDS